MLEQEAVLVLGVAQAFARLRQFGDVLLDAAQHAAAGRAVGPFGARVDHARGAVGRAHDPVLGLVQFAIADRPGQIAAHALAIVGMHQRGNVLDPQRAIAQGQSADREDFRRPEHLAGLQVPYPVAEVGDPPRLLAALRLQPYFIEQPLLRREVARERAAQPQPQEREQHRHAEADDGIGPPDGEEVLARGADHDDQRRMRDALEHDQPAHVVERAGLDELAGGLIAEFAVEHRRAVQPRADVGLVGLRAREHHAVGMHEVEHAAFAERIS